jgi:hypothetical protein
MCHQHAEKLQIATQHYRAFHAPWPLHAVGRARSPASMRPMHATTAQLSASTSPVHATATRAHRVVRDQRGRGVVGCRRRRRARCRARCQLGYRRGRRAYCWRSCPGPSGTSSPLSAGSSGCRRVPLPSRGPSSALSAVVSSRALSAGLRLSTARVEHCCSIERRYRAQLGELIRFIRDRRMDRMGRMAGSRSACPACPACPDSARLGRAP